MSGGGGFLEAFQLFGARTRHSRHAKQIAARANKILTRATRVSVSSLDRPQTRTMTVSFPARRCSACWPPWATRSRTRR